MTGAVGGRDVFEVRSDLLRADVDGKVVLFDPATTGLHLLNGPAALIIDHLDGDLTVAELARDLAATCDVDLESMTSDVTTLIGDLHQRALLRQVHVTR